jgi:uncharacterized protein (DUF1330 family)
MLQAMQNEASSEWGPLTPDPVQLEALRDQVGPGPVVMVNLLKFRQPGGLEAFGRYGAISGPLIVRQKGEVLYAGQASPVVAGREDWDMVILVRFPDIDHFIGLAADPAYQTEARPLREEALERTIWMVSQPAAGGA